MAIVQKIMLDSFIEAKKKKIEKKMVKLVVLMVVVVMAMIRDKIHSSKSVRHAFVSIMKQISFLNISNYAYFYN